jgi:hypothetical protein
MKVFVLFTSVFFMFSLFPQTVEKKAGDFRQKDCYDVNFSRPCWLEAGKSGCKVWNKHPEIYKKAEYEGECKNGFAHGDGGVQFIASIEGSNFLEIYRGQYQSGKRNGKGEVHFLFSQEQQDGKTYKLQLLLFSEKWDNDKMEGKTPGGGGYFGLETDNKRLSVRIKKGLAFQGDKLFYGDSPHNLRYTFTRMKKSFHEDISFHAIPPGRKRIDLVKEAVCETELVYVPAVFPDALKSNVAFLLAMTRQRATSNAETIDIDPSKFGGYLILKGISSGETYATSKTKEGFEAVGQEICFHHSFLNIPEIE